MLFCIVLVAYFCYKPQSWGMWLSEKAFNPLIQCVSATSISSITLPPCQFFFMIWDHYGKRVFSYFLQSVIFPLPAACSNLVGIFNKEISFVLDYEGHFENRSDPTNGFWNTLSFIHHLCSVSFFSLRVFIPLLRWLMFLVTCDEQYVNQGGRQCQQVERWRA